MAFNYSLRRQRRHRTARKQERAHDVVAAESKDIEQSGKQESRNDEHQGSDVQVEPLIDGLTFDMSGDPKPKPFGSRSMYGLGRHRQATEYQSTAGRQVALGPAIVLPAVYAAFQRHPYVPQHWRC